MSVVRSIGRFYRTDLDGNLINECDLASVKSPFLSDVERLKALCLRVIDPIHFHSFYLRGSVPRGLASPEYSDIDSFVILNCDSSTCGYYQAIVRKACGSIGRKIDFLAFTLCDVSALPEWELAFVMKVHSLCVYGSDLIPSITDYPPSQKIVAGCANIAEEVERARNIMVKQPESAAWACRWIGRRLVRAGLAICIDRDKRYSPDLWPCYCVFRDWYSNRSKDMLHALELSVCEIPNVSLGLNLINEFGRWISDEARIRFALE